MTKIYVVSYSDISSSEVIAVFDDEQLARDFLGDGEKGDYIIDEYEANQTKNKKILMCYEVRIHIESGSVDQWDSGYHEIDIEKCVICVCPNNIFVRSPMSVEHATKVAVEKHQEYLRLTDEGMTHKEIEKILDCK